MLLGHDLAVAFERETGCALRERELLGRSMLIPEDDRFGDGAPWTPPELAPRLVRVLASGRADALAGRYLHAEHDDIEELIRRADEIRENDLNAIRLRR